MLKYLINIFLVFFLFIPKQYGQVKGRTKLLGRITYQSSQNVYVSLESTEGIEKGDTLYVERSRKLLPAILVEYISSISCAGKKIIREELSNKDIITAFVKTKQKSTKNVVVNDTISQTNTAEVTNINKSVETKSTTRFLESNKKKISGKFSVESYSNTTNIDNSLNYQNWRYAFSLDANDIGGSNLSCSNYVMFSYRADQWNNLSSNLGQAITVYDLSLKYKFNKGTNLWVGRYLNPKISNISAIDGIQFEKYFGSFYSGIAVGSRPNFSDMGFNIKLFETGLYFGKQDSLGNGEMENTFSIFQQTNDLKIDRRFLYLQHTDNVFKNVNIFASTEVDLYKRVNFKGTNDFSLTSLFFMTRYSPITKLSLSLFYDARKNVIYYETFKSFLDSAIDRETRQGLRARINYRPFNFIFVGVNAGYSYQKGDLMPSRNIGGYLSISRIPFVKINTSFSYTKLISGYIKGDIAGCRISKYLFDDFVSVSLEYRKINYYFNYSSLKTEQNSVDGDVSLNFTKYFSLILSYDGEFENKNTYNRVFFGFTTRF